MCLSSASENRTAAWVKSPGGWKANNWTEIHYGVLLRAAAAHRIWHSRRCLGISATPSCLGASPSCITLHLAFCYCCFTRSVDVLMFVSWSQVMFYWVFNRSIPSGYLVNGCPSSSYLLGTMILIAHCNSCSSIKVKRAMSIIAWDGVQSSRGKWIEFTQLQSVCVRYIDTPRPMNSLKLWQSRSIT